MTMNALHDAIIDDDLAQVKRLIQDHPLLVRATVEYERTPLHNAVIYHEIKVVRLLLDQVGIEKDSKNSEGLTAQEIAIAKGWLEIVTILTQT